MKLPCAEISLTLHELKSGPGRPLLLLHGLYASSEAWPDSGAESPTQHWPGPVFALDFSGHGDSGWRSGGCYSAEQLVGDADLALAQLESVALLGEGLGAYVALLLAGARAARVTGALLRPGAGLLGGGAAPDPMQERDPWAELPLGHEPARERDTPCDPMLCCLEHEIRPADYALDFASESTRLLLAETPGELPPWWMEIRKAACARVVVGSLAEQLGALREPG